MANLAQNSAELAAGLREIAAELGSSYSLYRASAVIQNIAGVFTTPIDEQWFRGLTLADFPRNYSYTLAIDPLKPQRVAVADPDLIVPADYLVRDSDGETYFIGNMEPFTPIAAVLCNRKLSFRRQSETTNSDNTRVGNVGRIGNVTVGPYANQPLILTDWPGSVLYSGRGGKPLSGLPTDDTAAQWTILMPVLPVQIAADDILVDDLSRRYQVIAAEQNATGVRLICNAIEH